MRSLNVDQPTETRGLFYARYIEVVVLAKKALDALLTFISRKVIRSEVHIYAVGESSLPVRLFFAFKNFVFEGMLMFSYLFFAHIIAKIVTHSANGSDFIMSTVGLFAFLFGTKHGYAIPGITYVLLYLIITRRVMIAFIALFLVLLSSIIRNGSSVRRFVAMFVNAETVGNILTVVNDIIGEQDSVTSPPVSRESNRPASRAGATRRSVTHSMRIEAELSNTKKELSYLKSLCRKFGASHALTIGNEMGYEYLKGFYASFKRRLLCPIMQDFPKTAVLDRDGHLFDKETIVSWYVASISKRPGTVRCPLDRKIITDDKGDLDLKDPSSVVVEVIAHLQKIDKKLATKNPGYDEHRHATLKKFFLDIRSIVKDSCSDPLTDKIKGDIRELFDTVHNA